jgi:peptidoglycan/LPS O-acetylase OafA/YrhL
MKYIKGLDTLRAFAVICVIIGHWFYNYYPPFSKAGFIQLVIIPNGAFGVDLFFVLSGFLITSILLKAKAENVNNLHIIKNFIVRRALRIFPIYYLCLFFIFIFKFPLEPDSMVYYLTYTVNFWVVKKNMFPIFGHTWSLSVEEQFYLIWPWIVLFIKNPRLKIIMFCFILFGPISEYIFHFIFPANTHINNLTSSCFNSFALGGLYSYYKYTELNPKLSKHLQILFPISVIIYLAMKFITYYTLNELNYFPLARTINSFLAISLIHIALESKSELQKKYLWENPILNLIGKISYGLYLFHKLIPYYFNKFIDNWNNKNQLIHYLSGNFILKNIAMFLILIGICYLSFNFIEKPLMRLKNKFEYNS